MPKTLFIFIINYEQTPGIKKKLRHDTDSTC